MKAIPIILSWPANKWLMFGGWISLLFFGSTGINATVGDNALAFEPVKAFALVGMLISGGMIGLGAWFAKVQAVIDSERRKETRPLIPISDTSLAFAAQLIEAIDINEAEDLPLLPVDEAKNIDQLHDLVKRLRLREASHAATVIYYNAGQYVPRNVAGDVTQMVQVPTAQ